MRKHEREEALLPNYDAKLEYYSPARPADLTRIMNAVEGPIEGDMLDVGCGDGRAYYWAQQHNMGYVGIDYSSKRIELAHETHGQIPDNPNKPQFMCADLYEALESINPGFTLIWCCELLEHLEEPERVWAEMLRLSTGMVVCTVPVNMPHENHLSVWKTEAELNLLFPGIKDIKRMSFKTPGGKQREHFVFTA